LFFDLLEVPARHLGFNVRQGVIGADVRDPNFDEHFLSWVCVVIEERSNVASGCRRRPFLHAISVSRAIRIKWLGKFCSNINGVRCWPVMKRTGVRLRTDERL